MSAVDTVPVEILRRVRSEYREMPGLKLTGDQARRLWALDARLCERLLAVLVDMKFLRRTRDGAFVLHASPA